MRRASVLNQNLTMSKLVIVSDPESMGLGVNENCVLDKLEIKQDSAKHNVSLSFEFRKLDGKSEDQAAAEEINLFDMFSAVPETFGTASGSSKVTIFGFDCKPRGKDPVKYESVARDFEKLQLTLRHIADAYLPTESVKAIFSTWCDGLGYTSQTPGEVIKSGFLDMAVTYTISSNLFIAFRDAMLAAGAIGNDDLPMAIKMQRPYPTAKLGSFAFDTDIKKKVIPFYLPMQQYLGNKEVLAFSDYAISKGLDVMPDAPAKEEADVPQVPEEVKEKVEEVFGLAGLPNA